VGQRRYRVFVDSYGESLFNMDPYLHLIFRQPLPKFALGRWEASRIATTSWRRAMFPPAVGMAALF